MNPGSDPEIPSLKPLGGKEEEKKGGGASLPSSNPATPSGFKFPGFGGGSTGASKAFSAPNLKVRGLSGGGSTVMDRLKNLRKKDLIFIGAGLCTLGMAPLAEHLLMSPDEQSAKLQEGFNSQQGPLFQDGSSVYEPGNGVGSPGGLVGQGADIITPLNVRDPSNLIMSPGAQKKADAVVAPPPSAPAPSKGESDWRDVLRDQAKSGAGKAVSQAPKLPKPNVKMAGAIRGLSALGGGGGGTGAALKLDPLSAANVPNRAAGSGALTRSQATPGFRGATSRSNTSSGAGEDLRAAGSKQSDIFNRGGGAAAALDAASREAIPTGAGSSGGAGGRPGEGGETKNPGGNSQKDNKSLGESLAFLRQKMEMEKSLDLKWEKKKWNQFGRQKMLEESAIKLGFDMFGKFAEKAFIGPLGDMIGQSVAGGGDQIGYECEFPMNSGQKKKFSKSGPPGANWTFTGSFFTNKDGTPVTGACSKTILGGSDTTGGGKNPNEDSTTPSQVERINTERQKNIDDRGELTKFKKDNPALADFATALDEAFAENEKAMTLMQQALGKGSVAMDKVGLATAKKRLALRGTNPDKLDSTYGDKGTATGFSTDADAGVAELGTMIGQLTTPTAGAEPVTIAQIKAKAVEIGRKLTPNFDKTKAASTAAKADADAAKDSAREHLDAAEKAGGAVADETASEAGVLMTQALEAKVAAEAKIRKAQDMRTGPESRTAATMATLIERAQGRVQSVVARHEEVKKSLNDARVIVSAAKSNRESLLRDAVVPVEGLTGERGPMTQVRDGVAAVAQLADTATAADATAALRPAVTAAPQLKEKLPPLKPAADGVWATVLNNENSASAMKPKLGAPR